MRSLRTKLIALLLMLSATTLTQSFTAITKAQEKSVSTTVVSNELPNHDKLPNLPSPACDSIEVQSGARFAYRAYATGVQRYRWDGSTWVFVEPVATLFKDAEYHEKVAVHYAGPTWEANSGGKVVATKIKQCTPDATSIPWLLLQSTSNDGPGLFGVVSYIQRVNTRGGLAPTAPGSQIGTLADVPYTAEYYFYRP
ncbi:MAG TPA: DUF3455 domain-containing protein [Pyrinomonadaceae bacterium]